MANLRRDLPPLHKDAIRAIKRIANKMGDTQERELMNEASKALQRGDYDMAIRYLKSCCESLNLTQGERRVLEEYIRSLRPNKMVWLQGAAMKVWSFILLLLEKYGVDIAIVIGMRIYETLSVYGKNYGSSKIHTSSTYKRFRVCFGSGIADFCPKSSISLWESVYP